MSPRTAPGSDEFAPDGPKRPLISAGMPSPCPIRAASARISSSFAARCSYRSSLDSNALNAMLLSCGSGAGLDRLRRLVADRVQDVLLQPHVALVEDDRLV